MASEMEKLVCFTTQNYNVPSDMVDKRFVSTIAAEIDSIKGRKWNAEQAIVFQTVILQRVRLVTGVKNICARINT